MNTLTSWFIYLYESYTCEKGLKSEVGSGKSMEKAKNVQFHRCEEVNVLYFVCGRVPWLSQYWLGGLCFLWFYVQELPKAQPAVVLVFKRLRRRDKGLKSHPTDWEKRGIDPATPGLQDIGLSPKPRRFIFIVGRRVLWLYQ